MAPLQRPFVRSEPSPAQPRLAGVETTGEAEALEAPAYGFEPALADLLL